MANFNNYTNYADNAGVSSVIFGANSTVLEVELNEMQEIQTHYLRELIRSTVGNGITDISKLTYANGKITIADGCNILCNGYLIKANKLEMSITSGTAYLWVWEDVIDYGSTLHIEGNYSHTDSVKNWIKDPRANNETTKRKVIRYQMSNVIPADETYSYIPIAKIIGKQMIKLVNEVNFNKLPGYMGDDVYGVEVDWENNTSIRLSGSVGKTGGTDHNDIMAYNRRKCNVTADGTVTAYYGDANYTETGKTADGTLVQVMVEQNKFYYKVVPLKLEKIEDGIGYKIRKARYYISDTPKDGFKVHPAFVRNGIEVDKIYIASYKSALYSATSGLIMNDEDVELDMADDSLSSVAGVKPSSGLNKDLTRANFGILASNIGNNWQIKDFTIMNMDILLFLVEYASTDMQKIVGLGYTSEVKVDTSNYANLTGTTTNLGNNTGMADGENGLASIIYRGEEDIFGSMWEFIGGVNVDAEHNMVYWADHGFAENTNASPYKSCGFTRTPKNGKIVAFGYSIDCDFAFIAVETTDIVDPVYDDVSLNNMTIVSGWNVLLYGGGWNGTIDCGLCSISTFCRPNEHYNFCSRLAYIPID